MMLLVPVLVRALASTVSPGAIASFNYATKIVDLPTGVLVTSLATVALAKLSQHYAQGDDRGARQVMHDGIRRSLTNAIGAGILIAYFAPSFIHIALGRGAMDANAITRVVELTQILMATLPFLALSGMFIADLNAREMQSEVLKATLCCLLPLPFLVLPGVLSQSEVMLISSIVGFHVCHSIILMRLSARCKSVWSIISGQQFLFNLAVIACILLVAILLDITLLTVIESSEIFRVALAAIAVGLVVVLPHRLQSHKQGVGSIQ
jgi:putative peptidoglycan lipid II flippase